MLNSNEPAPSKERITLEPVTNVIAIHNLWEMLKRGCKSFDAVTGFQDYVLPFSSNKFIKNASYLEREKGSYRTPNLLNRTH